MIYRKILIITISSSGVLIRVSCFFRFIIEIFESCFRPSAKIVVEFLYFFDEEHAKNCLIVHRPKLF